MPHDVFAPSLWEHGDTGLTNCGNFDGSFPNISPSEINLGTRYELKRKKKKNCKMPRTFLLCVTLSIFVTDAE